MEQGADDTDKYHVFFSQNTKQHRHCSKTEHTAAEAVAEGYHLSDDYAADQDTHEKGDECILPIGIVEQPECDDIGKSQFDTGDGSQRGQYGFDCKDSKCDRSVHGKKGHMFNFHREISEFYGIRRGGGKRMAAARFLLTILANLQGKGNMLI